MKELVKQIFDVKPEHFERLALQVFHFQFNHIPIYNAFCTQLNRTPTQVHSLYDIPCLPIAFFKTHALNTHDKKVEIVFKSSGTGGSRSQHYVHDVGIYTTSFKKTFSHFYPEDYAVLALLPGYVENGDSSLVYMCQHLIAQSSHPESGFYLNNMEQLYKTLQQLKTKKTPTLLMGVSHALLSWIAQYTIDFKELIVMETGGMKGKGRELTRAELHQNIQQGFGVKQVHSEYGMTELLSQAYAHTDGQFYCPNWMHVWIREINDPFGIADQNKTGCINIIDLANLYSVSFIATDDLGKKHGQSFEVLGRYDHTEARGCNLLI